MKRLSLCLCDIGLDDVGSITGGQLFLRAFRRLPDPLHGGKVSGEIHPCLFSEFIYDPADNPLVEVVSSQVVISGSGENFYDSFSYFYNRYVESSAAEIIHHDFLGFAVIQSVREGCAGRLVDDTLHI